MAENTVEELVAFNQSLFRLAAERGEAPYALYSRLAL